MSQKHYHAKKMQHVSCMRYQHACYLKLIPSHRGCIISIAVFSLSPARVLQGVDAPSGWHVNVPAEAPRRPSTATGARGARDRLRRVNASSVRIILFFIFSSRSSRLDGREWMGCAQGEGRALSAAARWRRRAGELECAASRSTAGSTDRGRAHATIWRGLR